MKLQLAPSLLLIVAATWSTASAKDNKKKQKHRMRLLDPNKQNPSNNNGQKKGHVFKPIKEGKVAKGHPDAPGRIKNSYLVELKGFDVSETSNSYRHLNEEQCNFDIFKAEVEAKCANSVQPREGEPGVCDYTFKGNPQAIAECCEALDDVALCEEDAEVTPDTLSWGLDRLDQDLGTDGNFFMHDSTYGDYNGNQAYNGEGVHVYIIDTGLDGSHPEFAGRVSTGKDIIAEDITQAGVDNDSCSHGTHITGTCCGATTGVAPGVTIHPLRALNCGGSNSNIKSALHWARKRQIEHYALADGTIPMGVIVMSFTGGYSYSVDNLSRRAYEEANLIPVTSAGNDGSTACGRSPGGESVITVAASNEKDEVLTTSNHGECVDIVAPGRNIYSSLPGGHYGLETGTSTAAPAVAGALALVIEEKFSDVGDGSDNVGIGSIFQRVRNHALNDTLADLRGSPDLLLNVGCHQEWHDKWVLGR